MEKLTGPPGPGRKVRLASEGRASLLAACLRVSSRVPLRGPHTPSRPARAPPLGIPGSAAGAGLAGRRGRRQRGPKVLQQLFWAPSCLERMRVARAGAVRREGGGVRAWSRTAGPQLDLGRCALPLVEAPPGHAPSVAPPALIGPPGVPPPKPLATPIRALIGSSSSRPRDVNARWSSPGPWTKAGRFIGEGRGWGTRWGETINTEECRGGGISVQSKNVFVCF